MRIVDTLLAEETQVVRGERLVSRVANEQIAVRAETLTTDFSEIRNRAVLQPCPSYNDFSMKSWCGAEDRKDQNTGRRIPRYHALEKIGFDPNVTLEMSEEQMDEKMLRVIELSR